MFIFMLKLKFGLDFEIQAWSGLLIVLLKLAIGIHLEVGIGCKSFVGPLKLNFGFS